MLDLTKKKILVAGGNGFLGSHVVQGLRRRGVPEGNIFIPTSKEFDLRKMENCERVVKGQEILFDFAVVAGDLSRRMQIPGELFYDNLMMSVQILEAARRAGMEKVVSIGSAVEYPENAPAPLKETDLWMGEQAPVNIPYGFAKKTLLLQGQAYRAQYGFDTIHLLLTNVFGPRERVASGYLMPSLIQRVIDAKREKKTSIEVWGTGEALRDFMYVDDAVEGILLAAERYDEGEPVNLGTGFGVSIKELVVMISKIVGYTGEVRWDTTKPNGQMRRVMDIHRAEKMFGFRTKTKLEEGLKATVEWHEKNS